MAAKIMPKLFNANLKISGHIIHIKDINKCSGFSKIKGLMFSRKEKANALLFEFSEDTKRSIHSLFCPPFMAIWLNENNKIVEYKIISSNRFSVRPEKLFRKLIEVPLNSKYSPVVEFLLERGKV
ncbi:DUF192 domain-containing protein [Candidatus Pacearchaeota archaeon]|nr:DUF192 domain-containing protein [Candidatus Pacearchaeota archaeon]